MRSLIDLVESAQDISKLTIQDVLSGIRPRYANAFEHADYIEFSGRFDTAEAFADRLVDEHSETAALAREVLIAEWNFWEENGYRGRPVTPPDPLGNASPLARHIAKAIGATTYKPTKQVPWRSEMMFGPDCYTLTTDRGGVFLDAVVFNHKVLLSQISVENRASGLGSEVMEAIRDYATQHNLGFEVSKVTNHRFFDRFDWLVREGYHTYVMSEQAGKSE